jgi:hypothetical protein
MLRFIHEMVRYDSATDLVHFVALNDKSQYVRFSVTRSVLARRAGVPRLHTNRLLKVFEYYAREIHQIAASLYARRRNGPDEIMIKRIGSPSPPSKVVYEKAGKTAQTPR